MFGFVDGLNIQNLLAYFTCYVDNYRAISTGDTFLHKSDTIVPLVHLPYSRLIRFYTYKKVEIQSYTLKNQPCILLAYLFYS